MYLAKHMLKGRNTISVIELRQTNNKTVRKEEPIESSA